MRVLVVDDDLDSLDIFSTLCKLWGHEVRTLQESTLALAAALELQPDVILLDLGMPEMDGLQVAVLIRQQPRLEGAFLVAVTGYGMEKDRTRAFEAGFDDHLLKPVAAQDLKQCLERCSRWPKEAYRR